MPLFVHFFFFIPFACVSLNLFFFFAFKLQINDKNEMRPENILINICNDHKLKLLQKQTEIERMNSAMHTKVSLA